MVCFEVFYLVVLLGAFFVCLLFCEVFCSVVF